MGGRYTFAFLNASANAPLAASGGVNISQTFSSANVLLSNPALLGTASSKRLSLNYSPHFAQISHASVAYADSLSANNYWGVGLQYLNYGRMEETDPTGAVLGTFTAADYALALSYAHMREPYTLGISMKVAGSNLAEYSAYGVLFDLGGVFKHPAHDWTIGIALKNAGFLLKKYTPQTQNALPFDVQIGTTVKPKFMPLRFSVTAHHLHRWNVAYDDPALQRTIDQNGNELIQKVPFADNLARHFVFGTELSLGKSFRVLMGYNHLRRQELRLENRAAGAGFSFGASLSVRAFEVGYARSYYFTPKGVSYLTLNGNLGSLLKKK